MGSMGCTVSALSSTSAALPRQAVASTAARWQSSAVRSPASVALIKGISCPVCTSRRSAPAALSTSKLQQQPLASSLWGRGLAMVQPKSLAARPVASSKGIVKADWNPQVDWKEASIDRVEKAAEQLYTVVVDVSKVPGLAEGYTKPGQYVQIKVGDSKPAFMAIASPPKLAQESGRFEFLIKDLEGATAGLLCHAKPGDEVEISAAMGKGFNTHPISPAADYPTVLIFATGTGISPVRSLLEAGIDQGKRINVRLYYGARSQAMMAYQDRFKDWEASGVKVVQVYSQPENGWAGFTGYVQAAFKEDEVAFEGAKTGAILCGQKPMAEELIALLTEAGVARERILMNF